MRVSESNAWSCAVLAADDRRLDRALHTRRPACGPVHVRPQPEAVCVWHGIPVAHPPGRASPSCARSVCVRTRHKVGVQVQ